MASRDSERIPVHCLITQALTAGVASIQLSPSGLSTWSTRLAGIADNWAHFRVLRSKFRIHHGAITGDVAVGYLGGIQDTPPANSTVLLEVIPSTYQGSTYTKPSEWVNIPREDLRGPFPWYKSINGTADTTEEAPGIIRIAGNGTDTVVIEFVGEFQVKTSVAPANTPAAVKLRAMLLEERQLAARQKARQELAAVLTGPVTKP